MKIETEIDDKRLMDLLCSAFEGGSNYWARSTNCIVAGDGAKPPMEEWNGLPLAKYPRLWLPFVDGGAVEVEVREERKKYTLDRARIEAGVLTMMRKYPRHWGDFIAENDDAETGDVFLQCCLFGETVYG